MKYLILTLAFFIAGCEAERGDVDANIHTLWVPIQIRESGLVEYVGDDNYISKDKCEAALKENIRLRRKGRKAAGLEPHKNRTNRCVEYPVTITR